ncbi:hypothetical protein Q6346_13100 [Isoptericola sp. b490]|uniref:hypothetical protein n=1 Tax=Actinotalea lenta TaxID=3064654 RepID=UPI0027134496|nr:hypothetical protein [Isoptericola sp. b490]MDO8122248.1 hypothetical protein [Isoptericola sp. b490]
MNRARGPTIGVALPADWWTIDLSEPGATRRSITALVARQVDRSDERAGLRRELREELGRAAAAATRAGGHFLAVSLMRTDDVAIPATMAVYRLPHPAGGLAAVEAQPGSAGQWVATDGAFGRVIRRVRDGDGSPALGAACSTVAEYWFDPQDGGGLVLVSFSTPAFQLKDALVGLFDAIVATIRPYPGPSRT